MKAVAAGLFSPVLSSTASCRIGSNRSAGTIQTPSLPITWLAATKPSSALPLSMNCSVWVMFSPVTSLGVMAS